MSTPSPVVANQPPIVYILQVLPRVISFIGSLLSLIGRALVGTGRFILTPVFVASTPLLYILAPVIVFIRVLIESLILTPYRIVTYLLDALYPVYVFVGTACLCAGVVALGARLIIYAAGQVLLEPSASPSTNSVETEHAPRASSMQRKSMKRVSIKEEKRPQRIG